MKIILAELVYNSYKDRFFFYYLKKYENKKFRQKQNYNYIIGRIGLFHKKLFIRQFDPYFKEKIIKLYIIKKEPVSKKAPL